MLDRKVVYDIKEGEPLICGRRSKQATHQLQLGGTGIEPIHCTFQIQNGQISVIPSSEKAMPNIKINGQKCQSIQGVQLRPNDRICIGPSAVFLFKNKQNEANASMPDTESDPISFDLAAEEVQNMENNE